MKINGNGRGKEYNSMRGEHNDTIFRGSQTKRKTAEEEETVNYSTGKEDTNNR